MRAGLHREGFPQVGFGEYLGGCIIENRNCGLGFRAKRMDGVYRRER